ncbi:AraC family transcriptional regulator [Paenibacillus sp. NPDC058174]|uniref:AraC family transcriptional regulator n=1 Tax=Paenibacillus sp. NPDC058174 TaxID=3346366 RepID=UPI0036DF060D
MNIQYQYHGKQDCEPGYYWGPGYKEQYKIMFIHKGKGIYRFNDKTYALEKGQGFLVFADTVCYMKADHDDPWVYSWFAFTGDDVQPLLDQVQLTADHPIFSFSSLHKVDAYLEELTDMDTGDLNGQLRCQSLLFRLLAEWTDLLLADRQTPRSFRAKDVYVRKAMDYIHTNYSLKITISSLAQFIRIDRIYLSTLFKESSGLSPQQYLLQFRIQKACDLLVNPALSITDVSHSVGYNDPLLFSKMFKKVIGSSPTAYREQRYRVLE